MSFIIKNKTGAAIDLDDLGIKLPAGVAGNQTVDTGSARVGGDATGLLNDATVYTATIAVDGGSAQPIAVTGSTAQTYTTLLSEINADLTGAIAALTGGDIVITSDTTGATSSIAIVDTDLFSTLTDYVAIDAAVAGTGTYDMLQENPADVQASAQTGGDLKTNIDATDIVVLDPKDGTTELSAAESLTVAQVHNDPNWGLNGASLDDLDDVVITSITTDNVLQYNGSEFVNITPATLAGDIALDDLNNVVDSSGHANTDFFLLVGDGAGGFTVEDGATDTVFNNYVDDTIGSQLVGATQNDLTFSYDSGTNTITASVDDSYLRNDGDTLDSGTLTIASGASIAVATGGDLTIVDAPASANDATNKAYVDALVAAGATWKLPVVDPDLVEITATNPGTMASLISTYSLSVGDNIAFIASATITFDAGGTTVVGTTAGDIVNLTVVSGTVGDYTLIETPLSAGDRFIIAAEHGTIGAVLTAFDVNSDTFTLANGDLIEYTGGTITSAASWSTPDGRSGNAGGGTEMVQGLTVLCSDPDSVHFGHTFMYDAANNSWIEIAGPGAIGAGTALAYVGNTLNFAPVELSDTASVATDFIVLSDASAAGAPIKRLASSFITDLSILVDGDITASNGATITSGDVELDITGLTGTNTIAGADEMVFDDGASGTHIKRTVTNFLADLDIVTATADGIIVRTAADTYTARSIAVDGVGNLDGLAVANADGVSGNPTVGLDINSTAAAGADMAAGDKIIGYDLSATANKAFTGQEIADGVSAILGGLGSAYTTINGDTGSSVASGSTDTLSFIGATNGGIVTVAADGAPDSVTFAIDIADLAAGTTLALADELAVNDAGSTVRYTFTDMVQDLDIPNAITADGFIVRTAADTYASRSIVVDGVGATDGLAITNGDGGAANPSIGLDIDGNAAAGEDLAAGDKVIGYNLSGVANEAFTGQEVADGVSTMLGFSGLAVTTIGGQEVLTLVDTTRASKILSVGDTSITWAENVVKDNDWMNIGGAVDALSGYVVPLNATLVKVTAHTSERNGNAQTIELYINGVLNSAIATFAAAAGEESITSVTNNIDLTAGDKLRLRGGTSGKIEDTIVTLWLKWRG